VRRFDAALDFGFDAAASIKKIQSGVKPPHSKTQNSVDLRSRQDKILLLFLFI
jgi:hypothetical protein